MIAKIKTSANPKALIDYLFKDKENGMHGRAIHIGSQFCGNHIENIKKDWERYISTNSRLSKTAMHLIFSLPEGENLSNSRWLDFVKSTVTDKMGLEDFAWVAVKHLDTESKHPHLHIAVCRVSPMTGKTLSDSQTYKKGMQICREAEKKYDLERINNPWEKRNQQYDSRKAVLRFKIETVAKHSSSIEEFRQKLAQSGVKVIKSRGIAYVDEKGMYVKGSDRQLGFTLKRLDRIFERNNHQREASFSHGRTAYSWDTPEQKSVTSSDSDLSKAVEILNTAMGRDAFTFGSAVGTTEDEERKRKKHKKKKRGLRR